MPEPAPDRHFDTLNPAAGGGETGRSPTGDEVVPASHGTNEEPSHPTPPPPSPSADEPPVEFGRYRLLRKLGQGGQGAVYLAHDTELDRDVALKVPSRAALAAPAALERFRREGRAAAALSHPNLCPVFDVGMQAGFPYLTMAYVEGTPLSAHARPETLLPVERAAALVRTVASALQEAHARGIIHRDLKPSNVLLNGRGEPIVMDFGLARRADSGDIRLTGTGQILGTPAYMSPEQVAGDPDAVGPATDVYSLGVVLYELLTGRVPFTGRWTEVLGRILAAKPPPPSAHRPDLDGELEKIVLRAMAKKPEGRYPSMADLAADLGCWLEVHTSVEPEDGYPRPRPDPDGSGTSILPTPAPSRWRRLILPLTGAALLAAAAVVVVLMLNRKEDKPGPKPPDPETPREKPVVDAPPLDPTGPRPFLDTRAVLTRMRTHLKKAPAEARPFQRYFTLTHQHNDERVTEADLRVQRAALSKLLNSLSWTPDVVLPEATDESGAVFAIDLRRLGWNADRWDEVLKQYPYGLKHDRYPDDEATKDLADDLYRQTGTDLPAVRADWFVAAASRAPLYYTLLQLPRTAGELEKQLKVDVAADFERDQLLRAGLSVSRVSGHNRLLERHDAASGAYWRTFDFRFDDRARDLRRYPLGPRVPGHKFEEWAFRHDGGEVLFSLPNGLNGYLVVNERDERLDEAPSELVSDTRKTAGTPRVVAGLSCLACHERGVQGGFKDAVRDGAILFATQRDKMERLYPPADEMKAALDADEQRFLKAAEKATGPFLRAGADRDREMKELAEPIGAVARRHARDVGLRKAALELGLSDPEQLRKAIETNEELRRLGLGPLAKGGMIRREAWESVAGFNSLFQEAANALDLGTPKRVR